MDLIQEDINQKSDSEFYLSFPDNLYNKYISLSIRGTGLWRQICGFAEWVENEAAVLARQKNQGEIWIDLGPEADVKKVWIGGLQDSKALARHHILWKYLIELGIDKLCLDPRLEMNQVQDLFVFLKSREKSLRFPGRKPSNTVSAMLMDGRKIHFSCADVILKEKVLFVKYSYCSLRYSNLVHWFENRNKKFRDHRSLFHMAPFYGLIAVAIILLPSILLAAGHREWFILMMLLAASIVLYGMTYFFLMIVGSVEYDNEEKAYQLSRANTKLEFYVSRIQADIRRAQTIQQYFLPDAAKMPVCDLVDWASSYKPADEVGGDYFDIKPLDDQRVAIIFGDVCGHGLAAALVTAVLKTTFQSWLETPASIEKLAGQLNRNICSTTPIGDFAAVFLGILNGRTGQLEYINCGHNPLPWVLHGCNNDRIYQLDQASCLILGVEEAVEVKKAEINLQSGDRVVIVSDGIVENQDIEGHFYSQERFEKLLQTNAELSISKMAQLIIREAESFSKGTSLKDDQTLLAFGIK